MELADKLLNTEVFKGQGISYMKAQCLHTRAWCYKDKADYGTEKDRTKKFELRKMAQKEFFACLNVLENSIDKHPDSELEMLHLRMEAYIDWSQLLCDLGLFVSAEVPLGKYDDLASMKHLEIQAQLDLKRHNVKSIIAIGNGEMEVALASYEDSLRLCESEKLESKHLSLALSRCIRVSGMCQNHEKFMKYTKKLLKVSKADSAFLCRQHVAANAEGRDVVPPICICGEDTCSGSKALRALRKIVSKHSSE